MDTGADSERISERRITISDGILNIKEKIEKIVHEYELLTQPKRRPQ